MWHDRSVRLLIISAHLYYTFFSTLLLRIRELLRWLCYVSLYPYTWCSRVSSPAFCTPPPYFSWSRVFYSCVFSVPDVVRLQQVGVPLKWRSELLFRTESSLLFFSHWLAFWVGRTCIFLRQFWLLNHVLTWFTLMSKYHYCILMMQLFAISKQLGCANILLIVKCLRGLWLYFVYENKVSFVVISHDALFLARAVLHSLQKAVPISRWCRTVNSRSYLHINLGLPSTSRHRMRRGRRGMGRKYFSPQRTRRSGGASWLPQRGPGRSPYRKRKRVLCSFYPKNPPLVIDFY